MRIILTGATGLIGSRFEELYFETHEIIPLNGVDIVSKSSIESFLSGKSADVIVHLAAKTDVDECENDKSVDLGILNIDEKDIAGLDIKSLNSKAWQDKNTAFAVNAIGTKNLYEIAQERGMKFVYISTDFVFPGEGEYNEESDPQPVDWYGVTKWCGEQLIDSSKDLLVRLSFPYGHLSPVKRDFVWRLHDLLRDEKEVSLISDQTITPTFIDDIVKGLDFLLSKNATGTYHLTGSSYHTPMEIGQKIKEVFGFTTTINPTNLETVYAGKAPRPFNSIMKNDKIKQLGFEPKSFDQGLEIIRIN